MYVSGFHTKECVSTQVYLTDAKKQNCILIIISDSFFPLQILQIPNVCDMNVANLIHPPHIFAGLADDGATNLGASADVDPAANEHREVGKLFKVSKREW